MIWPSGDLAIDMIGPFNPIFGDADRHSRCSSVSQPKRSREAPTRIRPCGPHSTRAHFVFRDEGMRNTGSLIPDVDPCVVGHGEHLVLFVIGEILGDRRSPTARRVPHLLLSRGGKPKNSPRRFCTTTVCPSGDKNSFLNARAKGLFREHLLPPFRDSHKNTSGAFDPGKQPFSARVEEQMSYLVTVPGKFLNLVFRGEIEDSNRFVPNANGKAFAIRRKKPTIRRANEPAGEDLLDQLFRCRGLGYWRDCSASGEMRRFPSIQTPSHSSDFFAETDGFACRFSNPIHQAIHHAKPPANGHWH